MAKNPFLPHSGPVGNLKRNKVDLSRQNLFTSDWGKIYPFFLQEVIPGDSFKINASVGFRAMQTKFPLQSRIRTSASFFYVRNRTLWKNFEDFIFKTKGESDGVVSPWLKLNEDRFAQMFQVGGLADALGAPTTVGNNSSFLFKVDEFFPQFIYSRSSVLSWSNSATLSYLQSNKRLVFYEMDEQTKLHSISPFYWVKLPQGTFNLSFIGVKTSYTPGSHSVVVFLLDLNDSNFIIYSELVNVTSSDFSGGYLQLNFSSALNSALASYTDKSNIALCFADVYTTGEITDFLTDFSTPSYLSYTGADLNPSSFSSSPFTGSSPSLPINALPFRAYEMICNYYFRNDLNSPFMIGGVPQYNRFIPSDDGGADENLYTFHFHNWELDRFVSALPSPQFGEAPLVGLDYRVGVTPDGKVRDTATFTFQDSESKEYSATLGVDDDGHVVDIADFSPDIPSGNLAQLRQWVDYGFSINSLRNVNAFQRFLENSQRRGLRYRNQLKSHFRVTVDYPDIDVPQYIGGFSSWAQSGQVTNMAEMPDAGLGDYVGTLSGFSQSKHDIRCYCPEHGFIIGVYCVYPVPIYSQSIDKVLLKTNPFDYYQSEFGKIGFVPIHYSEISPLQTDGSHGLNDVFGYQRAWYDYLSAYDTCHGDFRTTLRDFVIQRLWNNPPELAEDFVRVNPTQLNDVFTTRNIADAYGSAARFLCSAVVNVTALRPIPINGVPSLE